MRDSVPEEGMDARGIGPERSISDKNLKTTPWAGQAGLDTFSTLLFTYR